MDHKLTIIVATLNSANTLRSCINGIKKQTSICYEVIFVDGGSSDATEQIVRNSGLESFRFVRQKGFGLSAAWNTALELSQSEYLTFHNSDDYYVDDCLASIVSELDNVTGSPRIGFGDVTLVDFEGNVLRQMLGRKPTKLKLLNGIPFMHPSVVFSRCCLQIVGQFSNRFTVGLDSDWLLRSIKANVAFVKTNTSVHMRVGGLSDVNSLIGIGEYAQSLKNNGYSNVFIALFFFLRALALLARGFK